MEGKQRNYSIDVMRMLCALMVIMCHTDLFMDVDHKLYLLFAHFIPRFTVPFFFCVSGYYYITALMQGKYTLRKQLCALLKIYGAWTLVYYLASFAVNVIMDGEPIGQFLLDRVIFFFTKGSYSHFWYFPALIYALLITTLVHHWLGEKGVMGLAIVSIFFWVIAAFGAAYYQIGIHIPILQDLYASEHFPVLRDIFGLGLPCFLIGYWLYRFRKQTAEMSQRTALRWFLAGAVLYSIEIYVLVFVLAYEEHPIVMLTPYLFLMLLFQLLLKNPMPKLEKLSGYCKPLSGFLYYIHPLLILGIGMVAGQLHMTVPSPVLYLMVAVSATVCGLICLKSRSRLLHLFI